ncbi:hypothetical protein CVT26_004614 [Gymnopilus dilepis]|uniref:Uncharacterized protein n=1 Tax=Gymnopilus dilepis TaxID=231916 RepID=A0A409YJD7_9AGAR|nr:hypothetical protein CVT26_004614 [Gymnopilus dilepis]
MDSNIRKSGGLRLQRMRSLSRHLPLITSRIEFRLDGLSRALPLITPRIDFADSLVFDQADTDKVGSVDQIDSPEHSDASQQAFDAWELHEFPSGDHPDDCLPIIPTRIPKPSGEPGRPHSGGYNLDDELGAWDAETLSAVNSYVKVLAKQALDLTKSYSKQDADKVAEICVSVGAQCLLPTCFNAFVLQTARLYPVIEKYENHWPVRDMLKLHLKYTSETHRKQFGVRKGSKPQPHA